MKKEIYVHIPRPCHENWEQMTPVQQGRFCQSCCKQVTDFSLMSDKQILDVLSKAGASTCGRFSTGQLERPIINETAPSIKPYKLFLSAFIPAFLLTNAGKADAQKGKVAVKTEATKAVTATVAEIVRDKHIRGKVVDDSGAAIAGASVIIKGTNIGTATNATGSFTLNYSVESKKITLRISYIGYASKEVEIRREGNKPIQIKFNKADVITSGEVVVVGDYRYDEYEHAPANIPEPKRLIKGKVVNEAGEPVPFATIKLNAANNIIADSNGAFTVAVRAGKKRIEVSATSVGYEPSENTYDITAIDANPINIILKNKSALPQVSVSCYVPYLVSGVAGGVSIVRAVTIRDTANTFIRKVFNNEMFKAYPNPAIKGSGVTLTFKKAGNYTIQVFDNSGKLYVQKELVNQSSNQPVSFQLPAVMTSGIYYLKATNTSSNKQFIDKLIIQ